MTKIIIIEDDEVIREELQNFLIKYGYEVKAPTDLNNIINYIEKENANLILLDINLPMYDGYYICREIRKTSDVPIIIVTSRDREVDELMSMNLGADDFITKPYNTEILLARITNILKRTYGSSKTNNILNYRDFDLNLSNATIIYKDKSLELTKNEVKIISCLINNKGNIVKRDSRFWFIYFKIFRKYHGITLKLIKNMFRNIEKSCVWLVTIFMRIRLSYCSLLTFYIEKILDKY